MPNADVKKLDTERIQTEDTKRRLALIRECGECQACCTTHGVDELGKKPETRCQNLQKPPLFGCAIYEERPPSCRQWNCVWRAEPSVLDGESRPDKLGVVYDCQTLPDNMLPFPVIYARETHKDGFTKYAVDHATRALVAKGNLVVYIHGSENPIIDLIQGPRDKVATYMALIEELTRKQTAAAVAPIAEESP